MEILVALLAVAVAAEDAVAARPAEALVLGLRAPDRTLETVFVDAAGVTPLGRGLAVPRKTGWWKVDVVKTRWPAKPLALLAAPAGRKLRPQPFTRARGEPMCEGLNEITVEFVGPEWVSFEDSGSYECEGDLRPSISVGSLTRPLGDLALAPDRWAPGDPFAAALPPELQKAVDARLTAVVTPKDSPCPPNMARPTAIVRHRGRWAFQADGTSDASVCRGDVVRFLVDVPVPAPFVGHDALPQPFERYAAERPSLNDVLASPSAVLSVLVDAAGIEVRGPGRAPIRHALPGRTVVMAQWAIGARNVERWRKDAAASLRP